jgi:hypothetical protein
MDYERMQLANNIKQKLIELNHIILDFYINEHGSIRCDYEIVTDKNTIVLSIIIYKDCKCLFDEILIYDSNCNNLLLEIPLNEKHTSIEIYELIFSYFDKI